MTSYSRIQDLDGRWKRAWRFAMLASVATHVLIFALFGVGMVEPPDPFSAAGPRAGDDRAAAGGSSGMAGAMQAIAMRIIAPEAPQPVVQPPQPVPLPTEEIVEIEPEPEVVPAAEIDAPVGPVNVLGTPATGTTTGSGTTSGTGPPGVEGGTGRGDGGTSDAGLFRVTPPSPRGLILPPSNRPDGIRGKEVAVWVFVTERGTVVPDSTRVLPSTGDRGFDRKLREQAAEWVFDPARKSGQAVAEWFQYTIIL